MTTPNRLDSLGRAAKEASWRLAELSAAEKNALLLALADGLESESPALLAANAEDMAEAKCAGMKEGLQDRLLLTKDRISGMARDVRSVAALPDPVGQVVDGGPTGGGIMLERRRVPLGVVAAIYEARPNVTVDVASLCLKTGNAVILRGGKETRRTNEALMRVVQNTLAAQNLPHAAVQAITDPDRALAAELLRLDAYVDMLIPRGGEALHRLCREQSRIPVITGGIGVCHIFLDQSARMEEAVTVVENAKVQRPGVCNAAETLLVHRAAASDFLPRMAKRLGACGVTLHTDEAGLALLSGKGADVVPLQDGDLDKEWLSLDLNVLLVDSPAEAVEHIRRHGTGHSEAILTEDMRSADFFTRAVDAAAVYVNASTRFTDGGEFMLGAEVAVSTQKLHARGPMALEALTTCKWIGRGDYTVRR